MLHHPEKALGNTHTHNYLIIVLVWAVLGWAGWAGTGRSRMVSLTYLQVGLVLAGVMATWVSSSGTVAQFGVCSDRGFSVATEEGRRHCINTFQASACLISANIPLAKAGRGQRQIQGQRKLHSHIAEGPAHETGRTLWPFQNLPHCLYDFKVYHMHF